MKTLQQQNKKNILITEKKTVKIYECRDFKQAKLKKNKKTAKLSRLRKFIVH